MHQNRTNLMVPVNHKDSMVETGVEALYDDQNYDNFYLQYSKYKHVEYVNKMKVQKLKKQ